MEVKLGMTWEKVSTVEGLALTGQATVKRGSVLVNHRRGIKRYSFRRRMGDGHALVRWGRLAGATACYDNGKLLSVIFDVGA